MELKFYSQILRSVFSAKKFLVLSLTALFLMGTQVAHGQLSGLAFDGTDDYVSIPVDPSLNISSAMTIEAWLYINKPNPFKKHTQNVVSKADRADNTGYIFPRSDDEWQHLQFLLYINGYGWQVLSVPFGDAYLNQWHHLAATFDGANMNIYIDGVLAGTQAFAGSILTNNNPLYIGDHPGDDEHFLGTIDELRIWNRALSQCEIGNNMNCQLVLPQNGLAAYYQFNPVLLPLPQLTVLKDQTTNANDGVLNNFSLTGIVSNWVTGHISSGSCSVFTPVTATASSSAVAVPVNGTINLFATGGGTYSWVGPNGFTSTQQNPVLNNVPLSAGGTYTVTVTSNSCSATASVVVGVANKATGLSFDGVDDYISIPRSSSLNIGNTGKNFSIETWVKPMNNLPAVQSVVTDASYTKNDGFVFPRTDDGWSTFTFWLKINGVWQGVSAPMPVGAIGTWQHLAATYDGFYMRIYLNGVLANSLAATGTITASTNPITIGTQISPNSENFNGTIDELRFWNRTLTQCEISNNMSCELFGGYNANVNGIGSQTALSAYYRFNQGLIGIDNTSFNTVADSSLNGNIGTMYHFAKTGTSSNWVAGKASGNCAVYVAPPDATLTSNGPIVEVGTQLSLSATGGTSYAWTGPNGFTANTASVSIPSAQLNQSGNYSVTVTGSGCTQVLSTKISVAYRAGTLDFDGVDDQVTVPNSSSLNISNQITLESWVYATDATRNTQDVMGKSTLTNNSGYIFPRTDDGWQNCIFYLQINGVWQTLNAPYPGLNAWHHLAATYDGFYMRIYVDGIAKASKQVIGTITENTNDLVLGQQPGYEEYFKGQIDEAKIWNRALNQCEIINNMNCEMDPSAQHGLAAYYRFNQAFEGQDNPTETTLLDLSGNANNGTLANFALSGTHSNWGKSNITGACQPYTLPDVVASANGTIFGVGSVIKLNATGAINGAPYNWEGPDNFVSTFQAPSIANAQTSNTGVYTVTVPYVKCSITASTGVTVIQGNIITADGPTTICPSSAVTLNAPNNTGVTYKWYLNDVLIPTATGATYAASQTGNYTVSEDNGHDIIVSVPISVTVVDDLAPVPDVATLPVLNLATPGEITTIPTATDNCRGVIQGVPNIPLATYNTPGTYSITWTYDDQNGHVVTQDQQIVVVLGVDIVPPVLTAPANITLSANTTDCGAVANFTATATDNSGLPVTITYSQNPGTVFSVGVNTVTVTATDQSGNQDQKTFTVTVQPTVVAPITGNGTICAGATTALSSATTGATWSSANPAIATVDASGVVTGIAAGTANILYTTACGVFASKAITVNALPVATVTAGSATAFCTGGSVNLSVPSQTGNTYQWYNGSTAIVSAQANTYVASTTGAYSVVVTNSTGCKSTSAATSVTVNTLPSAVITEGAAASFCTGSSVTLHTTTQSGVTYQWYNGANTIASANGSSYTATASGSYSVVVTNASGCQSTSGTTVVTENALPTATITASASVNLCTGGSVFLVGTGATGNTYKWFKNGNLITDAMGSAYLATDAGDYTVEITNANGCKAVSAPTTVTLSSIPTASITAASATTFCAGGSVVINAASQTGNTYQWFKGASAIASATGSSYTATTSGDYTVVVSNQGGCQATSNSITVTANPLPVASITAASATTFCSGGSVVINAVSQTGNTYQWYNGANAIASASGSSYTATASGNYSVVVSNGGCQATSNNIAVTVNALPAATITAGSATSFCAGGSVNLSAGSQSGNTYQWYNGANAIASATASAYTATATGNYTVIVKNASGCQATSNAIAVTVNALPTVSPITGNTSVNTGATTQLADQTSGGQWSSSNANATVSATGLVTGVSAGTSTITYTVTNGSGCATSVSTVVTVSAQPVCTAPVFSGINNIVVNAANGQCNATAAYTTTVTATGTPTLTYTLSGATVKSGSGNGSGNVFNTGITNVTVTATNACGSATTHFTVTVKDVTAPVPTVTTLPTITGQCSVSIVITSGSGSNHDGDHHDGDHHDGDHHDGDHHDGDHHDGHDDHHDSKYNYGSKYSWLDLLLGLVNNKYGNKDDDHNGNKYGWENKYDNDDHRGKDDDKGHKNDHEEKGNKYGWNGKDDHDNRGGNDDHHDNDDHGHIDCTNGSVQITAPTATDNCSASLIVGTTTDPLTYSTKGTYLIHWKFDDGKGNVTIQTQTVIVKDDEAPVPTQSNLSTIRGTCSVTVTTRPTAKDGCKGTITGTTTDPLSYSGSGTYVIHWTYDDGNGNQSYQNQTVIISDDTRPVISDVRDVTVNCAGSVDPSITGRPAAYDNCSEVSVTYTDNVSGNGSYIIRTWKATDASGNYSTSTQKITINDNVRPVITTVPDVTVGCSGSTDPSSTGVATATDNCSEVTLTYSDKISGNTITRTWKAADASGNYSTSVQNITMGTPFNAAVNSVPTSSVYTGGESNNLYLGYGAQSTVLQVASLPSSGAPYTYNWGGSYINRLSNTNTAAPVFTPASSGYYSFSVLVTNKYGCTSTAAISICVTDIRVAGTNGNKVYVCHKAGKATQTLSVSISAVPAHLTNHGDMLGSCDQTPCNTTAANAISSNSSTITKETTNVVTSEDELKVTVMPNPSTTYFTLKFESKYQTPVNLRVMDASGRMIDAKSKLGSNSTIQIGTNYASGTYYAEITQGGLRKVVQLIKSR